MANENLKGYFDGLRDEGEAAWRDIQRANRRQHYADLQIVPYDKLPPHLYAVGDTVRNERTGEVWQLFAKEDDGFSVQKIAVPLEPTSLPDDA